MATTEELIAQLSLRAQGLELMNPAKSGAYAELKARGDSVVEPLIEALPEADAEAASPILSLLGQAGDPRAIGPILGRLADPNSNVRYEAVTALSLFPTSDLAVAGAAPALVSRAQDPDRYVRDAATALAAKLGAVPSGSPWYAGAAGWEPLAKAFVGRELVKPHPDFRSLADHLAAYSAAERHAAWIDVAQEAPTRMGRTRAYLEALHNDPDPTSVAWGWLDGDFDLMGRVEHVIGPGDARDPATVEANRDRLGSIIEAGGGDLPDAAAKPVAPQQKAVAQAAPASAAAVPAQTVSSDAGVAVPEAAPPVASAVPVAAPIAPAGPAAPAWAPTHFVPAGGMPAWDYPDPTRQPRVALNMGLGLVIDAVAGDWALVRAVNGWRGWVDGRRLTRRA